MMNPNAAAFALILKQRQQSATIISGNQAKPNQYASVQNHHSSSSIVHKLSVSSVKDWYCESCDKEFSRENDLLVHLRAHVSCKHAGCNFSATKKAVDSHFQILHGQYSGNGFKIIDVDGQKFKVLLGISPDEVSKWRENRKSNFPSSIRTESKRLVKNELSDAGGVCDNIENQPKSGHKRKAQQRIDKDPKHHDDFRKDNTTLKIPKPLDGGKRGTLLKSLLSTEICAEENIVLQCLHFLARSDVFEECTICIDT